MRRNTALRERGSGAELYRTDPEILSALPTRQGRKILTPSGGVFYSVSPPGFECLHGRHCIADITLAPSLRVRARLGTNELQPFDAPSGSVILKPPPVEGSLSWSTARESAVIVVRQETLLELAEGEFGSGGAELKPPHAGAVDIAALNIAQLLKAELTRDKNPSVLYVDALIALFSIHLLRNYGARTDGPQQSRRSGLSDRGAQSAENYLRENFTRKVSVGELAAVTGLSPKHFTYAFTKTFGMAPHRYLLNLRLDFAEGLLVTGDMSIAEVAYCSGFSSQSHLTNAMKKYKKATPTLLRRTRRNTTSP